MGLISFDVSGPLQTIAAGRVDLNVIRIKFIDAKTSFRERVANLFGSLRLAPVAILV
jgi:hypothetical protein